MIKVHLDYESKSVYDLREVGLDRYLTDKSTEIILGGYSFEEPVLQWQPHLKSTIPSDLEDALLNPEVLIYCWNCAFERNATKWLLGIDIPVSRFRDVMLQARMLAMPGSLGECGKALQLPAHLLKMDEGTELKNMFCLPAKEDGQETLFGISEPQFRDAESNPKEWERFCQYNIHDVIAERAIGDKLKDFPLPEEEQRIFELDQEINDRGVYTDSELVAGGSFIASTVKDEYTILLDEMTGLENPNSRDQILPWLQERGYPFHTLGKPFVMRALAGEGTLTPECIEALKIRQQSSKTSASKLIGIANQVSKDNRLRYQYSYMGASRTGRWSSGSGE